MHHRGRAFGFRLISITQRRARSNQDVLTQGSLREPDRFTRTLPVPLRTARWSKVDLNPGDISIQPSWIVVSIPVAMHWPHFLVADA